MIGISLTKEVEALASAVFLEAVLCGSAQSYDLSALQALRVFHSFELKRSLSIRVARFLLGSRP